MKKLFLISCFALVASPLFSQIPEKIGTFKISDVQLSDSRFKKNQTADIHYILGLDADRLLAPYLKEAGLKPKAENYSNWENTGLDGHIGGHYLSALSYMYAATKNPEIGARLDYFLSELQRCQASDGYLSGVPQGRKIWQELHDGNIRAGSFGLNDRWVPLYNIHKIYAGLRDAYLVGGKTQAKDMLIKLTDWMITVVEKLSQSQIQQMMISEHGGLNETFADVYAITKDKKYLTLAHQFSDTTMLNPLLRGQDNLTGKHANTQIPKVIGYKRIADLEGLNDWDKASKFFWDVVIKQRSVSIGGNSMREHFNPTNDFSGLLASEQGPESCNTYNMLRLTKMLYQTSGDKSYIDYYERALYNHILSILNPVQGGFVYFTPMRSGHYRVYSQPQTSMWCCVGTGLENPARYGEMIYAYQGNDLIVNLFIPSELTFSAGKLIQTNNFPYSESTDLEFSMSGDKKFALKIRKPIWSDNVAITVNGEKISAKEEDGYLVVSRKWQNGDKIHVDLPMHLSFETTPDNKPQYSFLYGPIVLAAKTGTERQDGMYADDSRGGHIAYGPQIPQYQMPSIIGEKDGVLSHLKPVNNKPLTFSLSGLSLPQYENMTLVPFYSLYECRYQIYFPLYSSKEWENKKLEIAAIEKAAMELEQSTIDKVFCGEQQSESDHFISQDYSWNGSDGGVHFRTARGKFSYKMNFQNAEKILVKGFRDFRKIGVSINGKDLGYFDFDNSGKVEIAIPNDFSAVDCTVEFRPEASKETPRVSEIRILK